MVCGKKRSVGRQPRIAPSLTRWAFTPSSPAPPTGRGLLTDSYISDVHLRFHPPVIALACLLVTAQLREKDLSDWLATLRLDLGTVRGAR